MSDNRSAYVTVNGVGLTGLLTVLFIGLIGLKLTHYINWSWWWVILPIWISVILCVVCLVGFAAVMFIAALMVEAVRTLQRDSARAEKRGRSEKEEGQTVSH
jgi:MFS family permease